MDALVLKAVCSLPHSEGVPPSLPVAGWQAGRSFISTVRSALLWGCTGGRCGQQGAMLSLCCGHERDPGPTVFAVGMDVQAFLWHPFRVFCFFFFFEKPERLKVPGLVSVRHSRAHRGDFCP